MEVYNKSNAAGIPCDLITGEERKYALQEKILHNPDNEEELLEANHMACTAEMVQLDKEFDVAVIDEIQTIKNEDRGWAWTRALLGLNCKEIHVCGEKSAVDIVQALSEKCGDDFEVQSYERLTKLKVEDQVLGSLENLQPGDCIICFNKNRIVDLAQAIKKFGHEVAVIYGNLPPSTKIEMAKNFNNPAHPCKILIATDAIGMGLNLSIRRIIFDTIKNFTKKQGISTVQHLNTSSILQIAGRAGRFGTQWEEGLVTTMKESDLSYLQSIFKTSVPMIKKACFQPEIELVELYSYYLPNYSVTQIIDLMKTYCKIDDSLYFMSSNDNFRKLSEELSHIPLNIRQRYSLGFAPISSNETYETQIFIKFAKHISKQERVTLSWLSNEIQWPVLSPNTSRQLYHLEAKYNVVELYCWLSYNFPHIFDEVDSVRYMKFDIEKKIMDAVSNYSHLKNKRAATSRNLNTDDDYKEHNNADSVVAEQLIKKGIITSVILKQLEEEWNSVSYFQYL